MAEEKIEDPKPPVARRGARPFAGPAGASSSARPFLRPAVPSPRPGAAPFVPHGARPHPALGVNPSAQPSPGPVTSGSAALDAFDALDAMWASPAGQHTPAAPPPSPAPLDASSLGSGLDAHDAWVDDIAPTGERAPAPPEPAAELVTPSLGIPAWLADDPAPTTPELGTQLPRTPGGSALDLPETRPDTSAPPPETSTPGLPGPDGEEYETEPTAATHASFWSAPETPTDYPVSDWADAAVNGTGSAEQDGVTESLGDGVSAFAETTVHHGAEPRERPRFELVEERGDSETIPTEASEPSVQHVVWVSAALDRLAQRVRGGEIDVSSVAPDASEAAVLASVLAALLGGSSSR